MIASLSFQTSTCHCIPVITSRSTYVCIGHKTFGLGTWSGSIFMCMTDCPIAGLTDRGRSSTCPDFAAPAST